MVGEGFEPSKTGGRRIYSPFPLTTWESHRSFFKADNGTRTLNPRITSAVLYQLSYVGIKNKSKRIISQLNRKVNFKIRRFSLIFLIYIVFNSLFFVLTKFKRNFSLIVCWFLYLAKPCRAYSYAIIPAVTDTLSESKPAAMGILTSPSILETLFPESPSPSLLKIIA